ncbi:MAG TPA: transporter substrate-binding domain-containing protein [Rhodocyclaceae bacterium]|nr:transporter substrate-binding domain-containing protein [Rhodocyclaceae bacterium]
MKRCLAALLCLALAWASGTATAADGAGARSYVIGVENTDYYPLSRLDKGKYTGFARELLDTFAEARGYRFEYRPFPVPRLFANFVQGDVDFKFPDNPYWQSDLRRGKNIVYSVAVATYIDGAMVRPELANAGIERVRTLGVVSGFTPWAWKDAIARGDVTLRENTDIAALAEQVIAKRVDAAYGSVAVMNYRLDNVLKAPGALVFNPKLPYSKDQYFLSTQKYPEVIREFNDWLRSNGAAVRALKAKYAVEKGVVQ